MNLTRREFAKANAAAIAAAAAGLPILVRASNLVTERTSPAWSGTRPPAASAAPVAA